MSPAPLSRWLYLAGLAVLLVDFAVELFGSLGVFAILFAAPGMALFALGRVAVLGLIVALVAIRLLQVVRERNALEAPPVDQRFRWLATAGLVLIAVGCVGYLAGWALQALLLLPVEAGHTPVVSRSWGGFVVMKQIAVVSGLMLFEFVRLRGFEHDRDAPRL